MEHDDEPGIKSPAPAVGQVFGSLMDDKNDFPPSSSQSLARFYGLSDFVIICPAGNEMLTTESRINLVLSSITMAINNIQRLTFNSIANKKIASFESISFHFSRVPVFVQVRDRSQQLFQGVFESKNLRTDFQMAHLRQIPSSGKHLSGKIVLVVSISDDCQD